VWTVNQLARREPRLMRDLVGAGQEMRTAQEQAGSEEGNRRLQAAIERHRETLKDLVARAEGIIEEAGRSPTSDTLERVWGTLRAGSLDPEVQEPLSSGRVAQEIEPSGFPLGLSLQASAPARPDRREAATPARAQREAIREAKAELKEKDAEVQKARKRVRDTEAKERRAHQAWEDAVAQAAKARDALARAEESLADARADLDRLG
jgi:hypothetical protein